MRILRLFNLDFVSLKEKRLVFQVKKGAETVGESGKKNSGDRIKNESKRSSNRTGDYIADSLIAPEDTKKAPADPAEILKKMDYEYVSPFDNGVAVAGKDGKFFLIDEEGKMVKGLYDDAQIPKEGRIGVKVGSKWHFIDKNGKDLKFGEFDELYPFYGGIAGVRVGRYWRFIKNDGGRLNDKTYDKVEDFDASDGTITGKRNGRWITINRRGEEVESEAA